MRCAIYARSAAEIQNGPSPLASQVDECIEWMQKRGWELAEVYADTGAGDSPFRPSFLDLRDRIRNPDEREFDAVVVTDFDRIGRTVKIVEDFIEECRSSGVRLFLTDMETVERSYRER